MYSVLYDMHIYISFVFGKNSDLKTAIGIDTWAESDIDVHFSRFRLNGPPTGSAALEQLNTSKTATLRAVGNGVINWTVPMDKCCFEHLHL